MPADSVEVVIKWAPSRTGNPAVFYVLEWRHAQVDTSIVTKIRRMVPNLRTQVRVAGVDAQGKQGRWSDWSLWWTWLPLREDDLHED